MNINDIDNEGHLETEKAVNDTDIFLLLDETNDEDRIQLFARKFGNDLVLERWMRNREGDWSVIHTMIIAKSALPALKRVVNDE